ncbi:MAG TPA: hypothetical protein DDW65_25405 [Firmicutes bacterium]|jgi:hypothetical protein|nr:hypothetical protein [Bacillota bacterium]
MERARVSFQDSREYSPVKPANIKGVKTVSKQWRFRPRSFWPFVMWGLALFVGFKITVLPLIEGVYNYVAATNEINQLKREYITMNRQLGDMRKKRDYMKQPAYVEERAHEIGLVKPEESQMMVVEGVTDGTALANKNKVKQVEIGN